MRAECVAKATPATDVPSTIASCSAKATKAAAVNCHLAEGQKKTKLQGKTCTGRPDELEAAWCGQPATQDFLT